MAENMIRLICPSLQCRRILAVPPTVRGKTIRCSACGTTIRVPEGKTAKKPPADVEAPAEQ
jgi:RNase P subunit RPR2